MTVVTSGPTFRQMSMRLAVLVGTAGGLLLLVAPSAAGRTSVAGTESVPSGVAVVGYVSETALADAVDRAHGIVTRRIAALHVAELRAADLDALRAHPGIAYVERARRREHAAEPGLLFAARGVAPQWQHAATRADAVPERILRAAGSLTIGVVDTGADLTAPDLAAKSPIGFNIRARNDDIRDTNGHGTFVASLAAGSVTNGEGIAGFGGDAKLLVVKTASGSNTITDVDEAAAIVHAVDHGARIVNLSFGGPSTSSTERRAVDYAVSRDVLLIAAVGNDYANGNPVHYPAALLQPVGSEGQGGLGLAVGASTIAGARAAFSNTGTHISLAAPGEDVLAAVSSLSSAAAYPRVALPGAQGGLYGYGSGTSFAAPQVAGAAALVWAANPSLAAQQVAQILESTASGRGTWSPRLGYGVIDVASAVARAAGTPAVQLTAERERRRVRLKWRGDQPPQYRLTVSIDGRPARIVLDRTALTSAWYRGTLGHTYTFAVTALDEAGGAVASSDPLTVRFGR